MTFWQANRHWIVPHASLMLTYWTGSVAGKSIGECFFASVAVGLIVGLVAYPPPETH